MKFKGEMLERLAVTLFLAGMLSMAFNALPSVEAIEVLFEEDFESCAVGSFPSDKFYATWGGWSVVEEGGNKFLRSVPYTGANYHMITTQKFPRDTTIEFMTRHTSTPEQLKVVVQMVNGLEHFPGQFSVYMYLYPQGDYLVCYWFSPDGVSGEYGEPLKGNTELVVESGIWYKTKTVLRGDYARFYVDDSLICVYNIGELPFTIDDFHLYWGTWGQRDIDNIKVYKTPPPVGGVWIPIDKFELLAPWINLASLITVAAASVVYVKHRKKKQN